MDQVITILIVVVCAFLLVRRIVRGLRKKDCGCGGGSDCKCSLGCADCPIVDDCKKIKER